MNKTMNKLLERLLMFILLLGIPMVIWAGLGLLFVSDELWFCIVVAYSFFGVLLLGLKVFSDYLLQEKH